jgi:hypothetical protein
MELDRGRLIIQFEARHQELKELIGEKLTYINALRVRIIEARGRVELKKATVNA